MQFVEKKKIREKKIEKKWPQRNAAPRVKYFVLENICQRITATKRKATSRKYYSHKIRTNKNEEEKNFIIICMNCVSTRVKTVEEKN